MHDGIAIFCVAFVAVWGGGDVVVRVGVGVGVGDGDF